MIVDGRGRARLVQAARRRPTSPRNLRIQHYRGQRGPDLVAGPGDRGRLRPRRGRDRRHAPTARCTTVHAGNGYAMDIHEFTLTPEGDALFTVYSPVWCTCPARRRARCPLHRRDRPAGRRRAPASSSGSGTRSATSRCASPTPRRPTAPSTTRSTSTRSRRSPRGRVLISARDTSAIYELDRAGGRILWTLGGKASDFRLGPRRALLVPARRRSCCSGNRVSLFDDEAGPPQKAPSSRGLILRARPAPPPRDGRAARCTVAGDTSAQSEGSVQTLPGGERVRRLRRRAVLLAVHARGRLRVRRQLPDRRRQLPRLPLPLERDADAAGASRPRAAASDGRGLRELERRHRRSRAGRCWPAPTPGRCDQWVRRRGGPASRPGSTSPAPRRRSRCGRWTRTATSSPPRRWRPPPSRRRTRRRGR